MTVNCTRPTDCALVSKHLSNKTNYFVDAVIM